MSDGPSRDSNLNVGSADGTHLVNPNELAQGIACGRLEQTVLNADSDKPSWLRRPVTHACKGDRRSN